MPLNLSKPDTDVLDWGGDVNANFTDIETLVNAIETDLAAAEADIVANAAAIAANTAAIGYFDRGDMAAHDYTQATLTQDGAWHPLDVSGIVPEGTTGINVRLILIDNLVGSSGIIMPFGYTNGINTLLVATQVANVGIGFTQVMNIPASRKLLYQFTNTPFTLIWLDILGWFKGQT